MTQALSSPTAADKQTSGTDRVERSREVGREAMQNLGELASTGFEKMRAVMNAGFELGCVALGAILDHKNYRDNLQGVGDAIVGGLSAVRNAVSGFFKAQVDKVKDALSERNLAMIEKTQLEANNALLKAIENPLLTPEQKMLLHKNLLTSLDTLRGDLDASLGDGRLSGKERKILVNAIRLFKSDQMENISALVTTAEKTMEASKNEADLQAQLAALKQARVDSERQLAADLEKVAKGGRLARKAA